MNVYPEPVAGFIYGVIEQALFVVPVVHPDLGEEEDVDVTATEPVWPEM